MKIICTFLNNSNNELCIYIENDDRKIIFERKCNQNYLCEQISNIFKDMLHIIGENGLSNKTMILHTTFDLSKHITTYRILKSFIIGMNLNSKIQIEI